MVVRFTLVLLVVWLALYVPLPLGAAEDETDTASALLRAEDERIRAMHALTAADAARAATPPQPVALPMLPGSVCGASFTRLVEVDSADGLRKALLDARPGDAIHMADGVYQGRFVAANAGTPTARITLCGSRAAIIDGGGIVNGYGLHLTASHWNLVGFGIRNVLKGLMIDGAQQTVVRALEVYQIGDEAIHVRLFSSNTLIEQSWIHDIGLHDPKFGEGVYLGSAFTNWPRYTNGQPDNSDRSIVRNNVFGPGLTAEAVDIKEGTTGGVVSGNLFQGTTSAAKTWVDIKGNSYLVAGNRVLHQAGTTPLPVAEAQTVLAGWGLNNIVRDNTSEVAKRTQVEPFRAAHIPGGLATIVLPGRPVAYTLSEVLARFPSSFERLAPGVLLLKEHLLLGKGGHLTIDSGQGELRLLSGPEGFVSIVAFRSELTIAGNAAQLVRINSWHAAAGARDNELNDGRAYVLVRGGRMDIAYSEFADLGFGLGQNSGVAWKGFSKEKSLGDVSNSRFIRNQFGAYTYDAEGMRWTGNLFYANYGYGFDPHDFSNNFVVERNAAIGNGSHGIIFSRGCEGNIIRFNTADRNLGHGIFIDDGKVLQNGNPRYALPVPSNNNLIEHNLVRGNDVGIAFEGGEHNVVRENYLHANQTGMRLNDNVSDNEFVNNRVLGNVTLGIHLFNGSQRNQIVGNRITGGKGGVLIKDSPANVVQNNQIAGVVGRGVTVEGPAAETLVTGNTIAGNGSQAIDIDKALDLSAERVAGNELSAWTVGRLMGPLETVLNFVRYHPSILLWVIIFLVPLGARLIVRRGLPPTLSER